MDIYLSDGSVWAVTHEAGSTIGTFLASGLKRSVDVEMTAKGKKVFRGKLNLANVIAVGHFVEPSK